MEKHPTSIQGGRQPAPHTHGGEGATRDSPPPQESALAGTDLETGAVSACKRLVSMLRDAAIAWRVAADGIDEDALVRQMQGVAGHWEQFAAALDNVIANMSRDVGAERNTKAQLLTWRLEARAATSHGDKAAILRVCRLVNRAVIEGYNDALSVAMPNSLGNMIVDQSNEVRRSGDWLASIS